MGQFSKEIIFYVTLDNKIPFLEWYNSLNKSLKLVVDKRLLKVERGLYGENKRLGTKLWELKFKNGLRIYYIDEGDKIVILMTGGDKSKQSKDIEKANRLIDEYKKRIM